MSVEEIENKIKIILMNRFEIDTKKYWSDIINCPLLGYKMGIGPAELLYLFFDIEKEFNITISEKTVLKGEFDTIDSIINIVSNELMLKS